MDADLLARIVALVGTVRDSDISRRTGAPYWKVREVRLRLGAPAYSGRHGTRSLYVKGRCRCDACTKAKREYDRSRRRSTRQYRCGLCDGLGHNARSCEA